MHKKTLFVCVSFSKEVKMYNNNKKQKNSQKIELPERFPWESGFSVFKRRIDEQLQLNGLCDYNIDDDVLLPFYRMGESETYVLSALGCFADT